MWVMVATWDWYGQERAEAPEEYGSVTTLQDTLSGQVVIRIETRQPHDWWDDGVLRRARADVYYLAGSL